VTLSRTTVVVQPFVKVEMLEGLLRSLLACTGRERVKLLLFSDNPSGLTEETHPGASPRVSEYSEKNERVMALLAEFRAAHRADFRDVVVERSASHLGPYGTCRAAVDLAFESSDFVVFTEDDAVFARDALDWYARALASGLLESPENWAITAESIYFDARDKQPTPEHVAGARAAARRRGYVHQWARYRHLPATCFGVTRDRWEIIGPIRGGPRGDVELCRVMGEKERFAIFPIVPRVKNVGMLHPDGYAVTVQGVAGVAPDELFNTYVLSDEVLDEIDPDAPLVPFAGKPGKLLRESTLVRRGGFDETE
jgi:hypothetical protein